MKVLELFAGSRSIGRAAEALGCEVFSIDWEPFEGIDLCIDIELLTPPHIPFIPDFAWLSPDCTSYSIAAIGHHRDGIEPKTEYAKKCDAVNQNAINLINYYFEKNPNLIFFAENPRGMLRKMPFMKLFPNIQKTTVWYCKYGDTRAKPTDIFTNNLYSAFNPDGWIPRPQCSNNNPKCHHEVAPRGSRSGTQGIKTTYDKSRIPDELCQEILKNALSLYHGKAR